MVKSTSTTQNQKGIQWSLSLRSPYAGKKGFGRPEAFQRKQSVAAKAASTVVKHPRGKSTTPASVRAKAPKKQSTGAPKVCKRNVPPRVVIDRKQKRTTDQMQPQLVLTGEQQQQFNDDVGEENVGRLSTTKTPTKIVCVTPLSSHKTQQQDNDASASGPQMQLFLTPLQKQYFEGQKQPHSDDEHDDESGQSTITTPSTCPEIREVENRISNLAERARSNGASCTPHSRKSIGMEEMEKRMSVLKNHQPVAPPPSLPFTSPSINNNTDQCNGTNPISTDVCKTDVEMLSPPPEIEPDQVLRFSIRSARARVSSSPVGSDISMKSNVSIPEVVREVQLSQTASPYCMRLSLKKTNLVSETEICESAIIYPSTPNLASRPSLKSAMPTSDKKSVTFRSPTEISAVSIPTPMMRLSYGEGPLDQEGCLSSAPKLHEMTYRELQLHAKKLGVPASGKLHVLRTRINRHLNSIQ
eukprot:TRINITY_DN9539_c0_g1_i1.p1 TRINITY_DN9539_c0_g1~~TRINITY_DN9539_c0_g1_i1.p1  ORF type:complete len:487 (+),score=90.60 TRINITY_DN9539_c0_g1_i1:52-1461(+)